MNSRRITVSCPRRVSLSISFLLGLAAFGPAAHATDLDNDGIPDPFDVCPSHYDPSQVDHDGDGFGDACDLCPFLPGHPPGSADADDDGVGDACDLCPSRTSSANGDADGDGVGNECDNCPDHANAGQADADHDGVGDACDVAPTGIDPPVPFLVAPGKTTSLPGHLDPFVDRIVAVPRPTCTQDNGHPQQSCATPTGQQACQTIGAQCVPAVFLAAVELGQRQDIQATLFQWSPDGVTFNPIGSDNDPGPVGPAPQPIGGPPSEDSNPFGRSGWGVFWFNPPLDQPVVVRTIMLSFLGATGNTQNRLWIEPTPPIPVFIELQPLQLVSGVVNTDVFTPDQDVTSFRLSVLFPVEASLATKGFDQEGLGSEEQRDVGPNDDDGGNNFCGPTAVKNALHRLAGSQPALFPNADEDRNLQMAKLLARKMKTGKASGTHFDNLVEGLRDYLKERGLGCDNPQGYTVTSYVTTYKRNGSGGWAPTSSTATWDNYEKEMRAGEAVSLMILPWDEGDDLDFGTADDNVGFGHVVTGKDGEKNGKGAGQHSFSFVDPDDGKAAETTWQDRGGFPSVTYNGRVYIVHGFVSVSPKVKPLAPLATAPGAPSPSGTSGSLGFDTRPFPDGIYVFELVAEDATGNTGRELLPLEIDNTPAGCYLPGDLFDADGDSVIEECDNCPAHENQLQRDRDRDGVGDACDACPRDPAIQTFAQCPDGDGDLRGDCCDNCPGVANPEQNDTDDDLVGDGCDNCKLTQNAGQQDGDGDGFGDACDAFPGQPDPFEPTLTAPAKTHRLIGRDPLLPIEQDRRVAEPELRCDADNGIVDRLCSDPEAAAACAAADGTCRDSVRLRVSELGERDDLVQVVRFDYSLDGGITFLPIGEDTQPDDPPPPLVDFADLPDERNRVDGNWGWEVVFWDPPLDQPLRLRVSMQGQGPGGVTIPGPAFFDVFFERTPPEPRPLGIVPLQRVHGIVDFPVLLDDEDGIRIELTVLDDAEAKKNDEEFDQEGLGHEDQNEVGPDTDDGDNNYCGPTAAKNALHRLAEKDNRIYNDDEDRNLKMAKKLAEKMKTGKDTGTQWPGLVGGIRKYLDEQKVGCKQDDGYTVTEYIHEFAREDNGTPDDKTDDYSRPKKSKFSWDDYEKEMRAGEACVLLLVPWDPGDDGDYGTADDAIGFGHYVTGKDGEKDGAAKGEHDFSFVDPWDAKDKETSWEDRGGFPSVQFRGEPWLVAGFVAISPKKKEGETTVAVATVSSPAKSMVQLTWDTTTFADGIYVLSFYGFDAAGNAARYAVPVEVDNRFDVCPGDPGLADADADFVKDPCDNCPAEPNLEQEDYDVDRLGDACDPDDDADGAPDDADCRPLDETVHALPSEVQALSFGPSKSALAWIPPGDPGGDAAPFYDVLRSGTKSDFLAATCAVTDGSATAAADATVPAPGQVLYWLVRAGNPCGEGTLGFASDGTERAGGVCP